MSSPPSQLSWRAKIAIYTKTTFLHQAVNMFLSAVKLGILTWGGLWHWLSFAARLQRPVDELQFKSSPRWLHKREREVPAWYLALVLLNCCINAIITLVDVRYGCISACRDYLRADISRLRVWYCIYNIYIYFIFSAENIFTYIHIKTRAARLWHNCWLFPVNCNCESQFTLNYIYTIVWSNRMPYFYMKINKLKTLTEKLV